MSRDLHAPLTVVTHRVARDTAEAVAALYASYRADALAEMAKTGDDGPVTAADRAANQIILTALGQADEWTWLIDYLDGTEKYLKKNGESMGMVDLAYRGVPVIGVATYAASTESSLPVRWLSMCSSRHRAEPGKSCCHTER